MIRGKRNPTIHVIAFRKTADAPIQVRVTPDVLDMTQFAKGRQLIRWKLDTTGFHFPTEVAAIEFTSPGWEESFDKPKVDCSRKQVTVQNRNRDGLAFAYNVRVVEKATGLTTLLDPQIQNNIP